MQTAIATANHEGTDTLYREVQVLGEKLSSRESVVWAARGAVRTFIGIISAGVSVRLFIDSARLPYLLGPVALVAAFCFAFAGVSLVRALKLRAVERAEYSRYLDLRFRAGIDPEPRSN